MNNKNESTVFQKLTQLGKSPAFIIAVVGYIIYFISNVIGSIDILSSAFDSKAEIFDILLSVSNSILNIVPVLFAMLGLGIMLYACARHNESSFYKGLNILRIFTIVKTVLLVVVMLFSFLSLAGAQSDLSGYGSRGNNLFVTGTVGIFSVVILYVLDIVFMLILRKFIIRIWDASYEDSPMPDDGQSVAIYMIVLGALNAMVVWLGINTTSIFSELLTLLPAFGFALAYILFAITIYMYRSEMTKLYYIKQGQKNNG